jgi:putative addiction module component (TIGR02574 family)
MATDLSKIFKLSVPERVLLVEAIWDSIVGENDKGYSYNLSKEQITFLEEELAAYKKNPDDGSTWSEIKNKILNK